VQERPLSNTVPVCMILRTPTGQPVVRAQVQGLLSRREQGENCEENEKEDTRSLSTVNDKRATGGIFDITNESKRNTARYRAQY